MNFKGGYLRVLAIMALAASIAIALMAAAWSTYTVYLGNVTVHALAVSGSGQGSVINITVTVVKGLPGYMGGNVYVSSTPLPTSESGTFITSSQMAALIASTLANLPLSKYTFLINVNASNILEIGGPSASGYITAAMYALLTNRSLFGNVTMTGMIMPDGTIGPVGGIPDKVEAAAQLGFKEVLIPYGQQIYQSSSGALVNVTALGDKLGIKVIPVATIYQAIYYLTGVNITYSATIPSWVNSNLTLVGKYLYETLYVNYGNLARLGNPSLYNSAVAQANEGNYYTAASLLYQALIGYYTSLLSNSTHPPYSSILDESESMLNGYLANLSKVKPTTANLDVLVGIYDRIYYAQSMLNTTLSDMSSNPSNVPSDLAQLYVRLITLKYWFDVLSSISGGVEIPSHYLALLTGLYVSFAKSSVTYLYSLANAEGTLTLYYSDIEPLMNMSTAAEEYYQEGMYLEALAVSLDTIAEASALMHWIFMPAIQGASYISLLNTIASVATLNMGQLAQCNVLPLLSSFYIQYGDYWLGLYNSSAALNPTGASTYLMQSLAMYEESIAYSFFLRQLLYELNACHISVESINQSKLQYVQQVTTTTTPAVQVNTTAPIQSLSVYTYNVNVVELAIGLALMALGLVAVAVLVIRRPGGV